MAREERTSAGVPLAHLALRPRDHALLGRGGFRAVDDLDGVDAPALAAALRVDGPVAEALLRDVRRLAAPPAWKTGLEAEAADHAATPIVSFCRALDDLLGGGARPGAVLELAGGPATGKTQLCMQFCVDAAIPRAFHGAGGRSAFIDADGSFAPGRIAAMAEEMVRHVRRLARKRKSGDAGSEAARAAASALTVQRVLEGVAVFRCLDHGDVARAVRSAAELPNLKLLVVDSVAAHLRSLSGDPGQRNRTIARLAQDLAAVSRRGAAVVATNQMTVRIAHGDQRVPALSEGWSHAPDARLLLKTNGDGARTATLIKAPGRPAATAAFAVDARGVRDVKAGATPGATPRSTR